MQLLLTLLQCTRTVQGLVKRVPTEYNDVAGTLLWLCCGTCKQSLVTLDLHKQKALILLLHVPPETGVNCVSTWFTIAVEQPHLDLAAASANWLNCSTYVIPVSLC